jgi:hypothetical protein
MDITDQENLKYPERKTRPNATVPKTKAKWMALGLNLGIADE